MQEHIGQASPSESLPGSNELVRNSETEDLSAEVRQLRKELQTLNACFNSSTAKLTSLLKQQAQAQEFMNKQGQQLQQICSVLDALRGRVLPREKQDDQNTTVVTAGAQPEGHQVPSEAPSLAKRKRSEQEKEAVREKVARQRAAEQLKEQAESGRPVPILQPGVVIQVYPGLQGTPQWTGNWEGEYVTTCDYPSIQTIWNEWDSGILYRDGMQRTVPLAQMEEDLAFKRSVWRRSKKLRNRLHAMKMIIYHVIKQAAQQSRPISEVVRDLDSQLENQIEETKSQKAICTLAIERIKAVEGQLWKPSAFETTFLQWPTANERKRSNMTATVLGSSRAGSGSD